MQRSSPAQGRQEKLRALDMPSSVPKQNSFDFNWTLIFRINKMALRDLLQRMQLLLREFTLMARGTTQIHVPRVDEKRRVFPIV